MTFPWTTPKQLVSKLLSKKASAVTVSPSEDPKIDDSKPISPIPLSITTQVNGRKESNLDESLQNTTEQTTQSSEENYISSIETSRNATTISPQRDSVVTDSQERYRPNDNVLEIDPNDNDINDRNEVPQDDLVFQTRKPPCVWPPETVAHLKARLKDIDNKIPRIHELVKQANKDKDDPLHGYTFEQIFEKRKNMQRKETNKRKTGCVWPPETVAHLKARLKDIDNKIPRIHELVKQANKNKDDPLHGYTFEQIFEKRKNMQKNERNKRKNIEAELRRAKKSK